MNGSPLKPARSSPSSAKRAVPESENRTPDSGLGAGGTHFGLYALESLAVFVAGFVLMQFVCAGGSSASNGEIGLPGYDSYYHVKMSSMIPEHGLVDTFAWLKFTFFRDEGDAFVSHHYGFHVLLLPFIQVSKWITGDYVPGARWAVCTFSGLNLMLFNLLLITGRVRWRWVWLVMYLLMPFQFFTRHAFVRAIGPSLMFMQLILLLLFRHRYVLAAVSIAAYVHLYLGAVMFAPLLVGIYALSQVVGPAQDRRIPLRMVSWTAAGWLLGVCTYPYFGGMLEFLELQVFGSGLSPDISVGREWKPYEGVWWFAAMSGPLLGLWAAAICARIRFGPPIGAKTLTFLVVGIVFLILTLKARRFVEYWPVFGLLNGAYLAGPLIDRWVNWFWGRAGESDRRPQWPWTDAVFTLLAIIAAVVLSWRSLSGDWNGFAAEWPAWTAVAVLYMLAPLVRTWQWRIGSGVRRRSVKDTYGATKGVSLLRTVGIVSLAVTCLAAVQCFASEGLLKAQRVTRCGYDLPAIRKVMAYLQEHSEPGDVLFTDDWDIFPVPRRGN